MAKIAFIGGGNMSSCVFKGIVDSRPQEDEIIVAGPHLEKLTFFAEHQAHITSDNLEAIAKSEVIFLGVKPQVMPEVLAQIKAAPHIDLTYKVFVSMAVGWKIKSLMNHLGFARVVRIMPSTPAKIGLGITSIVYSEHISAPEKDLILDLLTPLGMTVITDEEGINALGAIAGSGPAFFFRFMEALVNEATKANFSKEQARAIVEQLALGSAQMVIHNAQHDISELREAVTSKGGTTYQGLQKMSEYKFEEMMSEVIQACLARTHEFEKMY